MPRKTLTERVSELEGAMSVAAGDALWISWYVRELTVLLKRSGAVNDADVTRVLTSITKHLEGFHSRASPLAQAALQYSLSQLAKFEPVSTTPE